MEVNSCFYHNAPALTFFKKEILIVVGGLNSKKCEYYSISNKKWKRLPELPEYRYGCSLYSDNNTSFLYLFGGYDKVKYFP
ncbi:MAG: kelch repeat-containing protein [archaeon]|nr:kelch repeat-containing protein [archaeon]